MGTAEGVRPKPPGTDLRTGIPFGVDEERDIYILEAPELIGIG